MILSACSKWDTEPWLTGFTLTPYLKPQMEMIRQRGRQLPYNGNCKFTMSLMPKAIWNGAVLAESDQTEVVEGNHYFPPDTINKESSQVRLTTCRGKGLPVTSIEVDGQVNKDAAWTIQPREKAKTLRVMWRFGGKSRGLGGYYRGELANGCPLDIAAPLTQASDLAKTGCKLL